MNGTSIGEPAPVRNPEGHQRAVEQDMLEAEDEFERAPLTASRVFVIGRCK